ncbi:MAG TPA: hypothetical protein VK518_04640 [Puia sp.]|nr:hypothetical protein [Puia sp.]
MFPQKSCIELKARPDYSHFLFTSSGIAGSTTREVSFTKQKDADESNDSFCKDSFGNDSFRKGSFPNDTFNLEIGDFHPESQPSAGITDNGDMNHVLTILMIIIELYLERYPERAIRLKGNTKEKIRLFRIALDMHVDVLKQHFEIIVEQDKRTLHPRSRDNFDNIGFLIRRRPGVRFTLHSIQTTRCSRSLLFGKTVSVEIQRNIEIGLISVECEN